MTVVHHDIVLTTDTAGAGTATTAYPINGEVLEVSYFGTALNSGTADWTVTRDHGGTILTLTNQNGPFHIHPREETNTPTGGTTSYTTGGQAVYSTSRGQPVDGYVTVTIAQAAASASGTVHIYLYA